MFNSLIRSCAFVALLAVTPSCGSGSPAAGGDTSPTPNAVPAVTPVGTSLGSMVTQQVGPAGGSMKSGDGHLTVIVPAGALSAPTDLTVEPISAEAPGALRAWRLGPDGQQFLVPVSLVMAYDAQDLLGSAAEALDIAFQKKDGTWSVLNASTLDVAAGTITAATTHFTDWSNLLGMQLLPGNAKVMIGKSVTLQVSNCERVDDDELTSLAAACGTDPSWNPSANWAVNGAPGGTTGLGLVSGEHGVGVYTAPATKPSPATVSVSTELTSARKPGKIIVVSNVTILDHGGWQGTVNYTASVDSSVDVSSGGADWPTTQNITVKESGHGTLQMGQDDLGQMVLTGASGDYSKSSVTTVHMVDTRNSLCTYETFEVTTLKESGTATPPSATIPGYATLDLTGSTYQIQLNTLDGAMSGTQTYSLTVTATGGCSPTSNNSTLSVSEPFPADSLVVDGELNPKTPNAIKGSKKVTTSAVPVRTYDVSWDFSFL